MSLRLVWIALPLLLVSPERTPDAAGTGDPSLAPRAQDPAKDTADPLLARRAQGGAAEAVRLRPPPPKPVPPAELDASIARAVAYLGQSQNKDGSWGSARWTGGVDSDPIPGAFHSFGVAVTAMCLEALLPEDSLEA